MGAQMINTMGGAMGMGGGDLPNLKTLGAELWSGGRLLVSRASSVFDANGELKDEAVRESVRKFVAGFVAHVANTPQNRPTT